MFLNVISVRESVVFFLLSSFVSCFDSVTVCLGGGREGILRQWNFFRFLPFCTFLLCFCFSSPFLSSSFLPYANKPRSISEPKSIQKGENGKFLRFSSPSLSSLFLFTYPSYPRAMMMERVSFPAASSKVIPFRGKTSCLVYGKELCAAALISPVLFSPKKKAHRKK